MWASFFYFSGLNLSARTFTTRKKIERHSQLRSTALHNSDCGQKSTAETTQCHSGVKKPVQRADQSLSAGAAPSTPSAVITYNSAKK